MNINRHNYEEFFLLYVDNELTAGQRKIVEAFVAVNPDLQEEFRLIQDTKMDFHAMLDDDFKASLLKPVTEEATINEEQLLLYIDNELGAEEKQVVDFAAAKSYELQKQLQLLKRTVATADTNIVFPDKSLLYKEAQPARVVAMGSLARRWAAAAAVLLLLGTGVWVMTREQKPDNRPVTKNPPVQQPVQSKDNQTNTPPVNNFVESQQSVVNNQADVQQTGTTTVKEQKIIIAPVKKNENNVIVKNNPEKNTEQKIVIDPQPKQQDVVVTDPKLTESKNPDISTKSSNETNTPNVQSIGTKTATPSYAYVNNNESVSEEGEEEGLLNETRQRSSGLKGFFKKARRTLERRTGIQSGDSQVRFAVFAVNTQ